MLLCILISPACLIGALSLSQPRCPPGGQRRGWSCGLRRRAGRRAVFSGENATICFCDASFALLKSPTDTRDLFGSFFLTLFCSPCIPDRRDPRRHKPSQGSCSALPLLLLGLTWAQALAAGHRGSPKTRAASRGLPGLLECWRFGVHLCRVWLLQCDTKNPQTNQQTQIQTPNNKTNPNLLQVFFNEHF